MNSYFWLAVASVLFVAGVIVVRSRARPSASPSPLTASAVSAMPTSARRHPGRPVDVLNLLNEGVVELEGSRGVVSANDAAREMLGLPPGALPAHLQQEDIELLARRASATGDDAEETIDIWYPSRATIRARAVALEPDRVVVLLEDVTDEVLAQRVRREFVAHASHELKSPVAGLQTLAEAVGRAIEDDPRAAARFSGRLVDEAARLGRLVGDLLDLSRLEHPGEVAQEPVDLSALARKALAEIGPLAQSKSMQLTDSVRDGVWVRGDDEQLGLMLRNLLENAVRYTADGGSVSLAVRPAGEQAFVEVSDTGIGIPLEAQARVFERFYRVDRARSRDRGGTGLGLAIVKHVAELHGGRVGVSSEIGRGSTFTVRLPAITRPGVHLREVAG